jgi:uncharacterized membrane protein
MSDTPSHDRLTLLAAKLPTSEIPRAQEYAITRAESCQYRWIDRVARFASSPLCLYVHLVVFTAWIGLWVLGPFRWEKPPFDILALVVSLEAVFLSTFVLIRQHRADIMAQHTANAHWAMVNKLYEQNSALIAAARKAGILMNGKASGSDPAAES